ncbi:MAG: endonuclease/exonuclease/phosphatase family protein [Desulfobacterales bacterium]
MGINLYFAWWNLENLFDIETAPTRPEWLQKQLGSELRGWSEAVLENKLSQLAGIILAMNDGMGPDFLGVCEVESIQVLEKLAAKLVLSGRDYGIVHADTQDLRGIDVAFFFDRSRMRPDPDAIFNRVILKRNATRDLVQATFTTVEGNSFIVIGNHWPSRKGGEASSEPYRMMAGETLSYWLERIHAKLGEIPVIVMGDFNDEPYNRSLCEYALSCRSIDRVKSRRARNPYLYNLMWPLMGGEIATHSFDSTWGMLDQILVNRAGLAKSGICCEQNSVSIFTAPGMIAKGAPVRFGRPSESKGYNPLGFSDHLPIVMMVLQN